MDVTDVNEGVLSVEVFAAKDSAGMPAGVMLSAPCKCGLNQADTLRIDGLVMMAVRDRSILPIDLPNLTEQSRAGLLILARLGQRLAVAEFTALGMLDAYFLKLDVIR